MWVTTTNLLGVLWEKVSCWPHIDPLHHFRGCITLYYCPLDILCVACHFQVPIQSIAHSRLYMATLLFTQMHRNQQVPICWNNTGRHHMYCII